MGIFEQSDNGPGVHVESGVLAALFRYAVIIFRR